MYGMNIIYNANTHKHNGNLNCISETDGKIIYVVFGQSISGLDPTYSYPVISFLHNHQFTKGFFHHNFDKHLSMQLLFITTLYSIIFINVNQAPIRF